MAATTHERNRRPISPNMTGMSSDRPPSFSSQPNTPPPTGVSFSDLQAQNAALMSTDIEDAPPAYTLTPDEHQGEHSIEHGPRRPFQAAPPRARTPPLLSSNPTGSGYVASNFTGASSTRLAPRPTARVAQAPRRSSNPSLWDMLTVQMTGIREQNNLSAIPASSSRPVQSSPVAAQNTPNRAQTRYRPPAGPPPPPSRPPVRQASISNPELNVLTSEFARDFYAVGDVPAPPPATASAAHNDGKPTNRLTPGHPLLLNGSVLIYPRDYVCKRCNNTGYKQNDPSNPCMKCWSRHSKPYTGAVTYAQWNTPPDPSSRISFQRPLPATQPHHIPSSSRSAPQPSPSRYIPPPQPLHLPEAYTPSSSSFLSPPGDPVRRSRSQTDVRTPSSSIKDFAEQILVSALSYAPPAASSSQSQGTRGTPTLPPGDARTGGSLCWRCSGRGRLGSGVQCAACGGVGRVFGSAKGLLKSHLIDVRNKVLNSEELGRILGPQGGNSNARRRS